jgi:three-Cys-motif partner protein
MTLGFVGDAITLSGLTGTKLKCDVIGEYYPFWWSITSGGRGKDHSFPTAIIELDAATGEVYIEDSKETVLGSAGHALELKTKTPQTRNLKVILIEKDPNCYSHLKNVIRRRWPSISIEEAEGPILLNTSNVYLLNTTLDGALEKIEKLELGNALFFFDPLRSVEFATIDNVASKRITTFYKTGTEFIIFIFTSDWFLGRDDFAPLPQTPIESAWSKEEKKTVLEADSLFGNREWRRYILNSDSIERRENMLIEFYKNRLHKWFRYILPLPFNPKQNQIFHLILCSNFETGVKATRNFYSLKTGNPKYSPDNADAFRRFQRLHPDVFVGLNRRRKPLQWRILWMTITWHEEGICDCMCSDFENIEPDAKKCQHLLEWLEKKNYITHVNFENAWRSSIKQYKLNWEIIKERLNVDPPPLLKPLSPKEINK